MACRRRFCLKTANFNDYSPNIENLRIVTVQRRRRARSRRRPWCAATACGLAVALSLTASPALAMVARSGAGPERGIDISAYPDANGPINWRELARHGIKFVVIKASESNYYTNPHYPSDAKAASESLSCQKPLRETMAKQLFRWQIAICCPRSIRLAFLSPPAA